MYDNELATTGAGITVLGVTLGLSWYLFAAVVIVVGGVTLFRHFTRDKRAVGPHAALAAARQNGSSA